MDSPASLGYQKEKLIKNLEKKYVTRLGFEPATSLRCNWIFLILSHRPKRKTNQKLKKKETRLAYEPPTFRITGG